MQRTTLELHPQHWRRAPDIQRRRQQVRSVRPDELLEQPSLHRPDRIAGVRERYAICPFAVAFLEGIHKHGGHISGPGGGAEQVNASSIEILDASAPEDLCVALLAFPTA